MAIFIFIVIGLSVGGLVCIGWTSVDLICTCLPISESKAVGILGLGGVAGAFSGIVLSIVFG